MLRRHKSSGTVVRIDYPKLPICIGCGSMMQLFRVLPSAEFRSEQLVLRCGHCELVMTQPGERGG